MITSSFIIASIILILMPGPGNIYTVKTGISEGRTAGLLVSFGCTLGMVPHLCLGILSIAFLQWLPNIIFIIIKYMGVAYLIYLGFSMFTAPLPFSPDDQKTSKEPIKLMIMAIPINLLNPKLTLFYVSFLPQFINPKAGELLKQALSLGLISMLLSQAFFILFALLASLFNRWFTQSKKRSIIMNRILGVIFIIFALRLLV